MHKQYMMPQEIDSKQRREMHRILTRVPRSGEIKELARELGVSQPAVSRWLRIGGTALSPEKQAHIQRRVAELSGINDSLAEQQRENQRAESSNFTQKTP